MQNEIKKITRLIDEITSILMKKGSKEIDVKLKREEQKCIINIVDHDTLYTDEEIEELDEILNIQRQCEVEGVYWELMGEDNNGDELFLVGSMIDSGEAKKEGNNLIITMNRSGLCKLKYRK